MPIHLHEKTLQIDLWREKFSLLNAKTRFRDLCSSNQVLNVQRLYLNAGGSRDIFVYQTVNASLRYLTNNIHCSTEHVA